MFDLAAQVIKVILTVFHVFTKLDRHMEKNIEEI